MALQVVDVQIRGNQGTVVLQSDLPNHPAAIDELQGADARRTAIMAASQKGLGGAAINGFLPSPYPVTAEGKPVEDPLKDRLAAYQIEIAVMARPA